MGSSNRLTQFFVIVFALYVLLGAHFFMHNPGGSGLSLPFNMVGWIFVAILIATGLWLVTQQGALRLSHSHLLLWAGGLLLILPVLYTQPQWRDLALPKLFALVGGLLFYFALLQCRFSRQQRYVLLYLVVGSVFIEALFALTQYYLLTPGNWIGYNTTINRPYGIFQQFNVLASFLATGVALALYLLRHDPLVARQSWRLWLCLATLASSSLLLLVIASRIGHLGAVLVALILWPMLWHHSRRLAGWALAALLVGIIVAVVSQHWMGAGRDLAAYQQVGMRWVYWPKAIEMFLLKPWLGWGYGGFEYTFVHHFYGPGNWHDGMPIMEQNLDHPHNETLYWAVEGGVVALFGLVTLLCGYGRSLYVAGRGKGLALLALALPILLHTQTEYPLYHSLLHWVVLMLVFWFADEEAEAGIRSYPFPYWLLLRSIAIGVVVLVVGYMATGLQTAWLVTKYERSTTPQPQLLMDVINPLPWLTRVEFDVMTLRLILALQSNSGHELEAYVNWGTAFIHTTPRANVYHNMRLALERLGRHAEAAQLLIEAKRLYPGDPFFYPVIQPKTGQEQSEHGTSGAISASKASTR